MKNKHLQELLQKYPDNMDIFIDERQTEFKYGLLNGVKKKKINFMEEPEGEALGKETVIILSTDYSIQ